MTRDTAASASPQVNQPGAWQALPVLIVLYALSLMDRQVLSLLVGPIKKSLQVSDFQIGLLQGLAFSVFYSVAAIPIGWAVDRYPRRPVIWIGVTLWSIAATACGLAQNFFQLALARLGVGVGEASLAPASYSMLGDLFRPSRLALAMSVLLIGSSLGNGAAIALGGQIVGFAQSGGVLDLPILGRLETWQFVFVVTGLPGIVLGGLIFLVREPKRRGLVADKPRGDFGSTLRYMKDHKAFFASHFIGFGLLSIAGWGLVSWLPVFVTRAYGWTIAEVSVPLAIITGVGGTLGLLASGWFVDFLFARGIVDAHLRVYAFLGVGMAILGVVAFQMPNAVLFFLLIAPILSTMTLAATAGAALQLVVPNEMRGQVTSIFLLIMNGVGLGVGPVLVGALTDFVFGGEMHVGQSLALTYAVLAPAGALALLCGRRPMRRAIAAMER